MQKGTEDPPSECHERWWSWYPLRRFLLWLEPNCMKWCQFRNQRRAGGSTPNGHPEMRFHSKEGGSSLTLSVWQSYHCVEVWTPSPRLDERTLSFILLTSSGTHVLCTHTGLNLYMIKPFRGLGEVKKWWGCSAFRYLNAYIQIPFKSFERKLGEDGSLNWEFS